MSKFAAIIVDEGAVDRLLSYRIATDFAQLPDEAERLHQIGVGVKVVGDLAYLMTHGRRRARKVVVKVDSEFALASIPTHYREAAVLRILQGAMSVWSPALTIPLAWKAFHRGSIISFQTNGRSTGVTERVYLDAHPKKSDHIYIFEVGHQDQGDLSGLSPDYSLFERALSAAPSEVEYLEMAQFQDERAADFDLNDQVGFEVTQGRTLEEWTTSYLTKDQLAFVNAKLNRSIRLRGAAGTGKTLALVIKFLRECYSRIDRGETFRAAFFAHSLATVELIKNYIYSIDRRDILGNVGGYEVAISTIHHQANSYLRYDLENITPISLDGQEGRDLQHELLTDIIQKFRKKHWIRFKASASAPFAEAIELDVNDPRFRGFVYDLMNEFACVIDAYGSKTPEERRVKYLRERRLSWMMNLTANDREAVLEIYAEFRRALREMQTISTDQMTADFLGYLDSFRWDAKRSEEGYDFIFVDELHLFNRQERLTLHLLTHNPEETPIVVMAYDPRQSPRDTFMDTSVQADEGLAPSSWKDTKLGAIEAFEFQDVFRYTPEILSFLNCLDAEFPVEDFGAEWGGDIGRSMLPSGPVPTLRVFSDTLELYNSVFEQATRLANERGTRAKSVAVLCVSNDTYKTYLDAGKFRKHFVAVNSRNEISAISNAGKRFVYSAPEYVAGLQFDTVFLIDVNADEVEALGGGIGGQRRFVSTLYLGASRAETNLFVACNRSRGGVADMLSKALAQGVVVNP